MGLFPVGYDEDDWMVSAEDKRKYLSNDPKCPTCNVVLPKTKICDNCD